VKKPVSNFAFQKCNLQRYNAVFKNLMDHQPVPMGMTEAVASSAVRWGSAR
jgi:hypothetical protein